MPPETWCPATTQNGRYRAWCTGPWLIYYREPETEVQNI